MATQDVNPILPAAEVRRNDADGDGDGPTGHHDVVSVNSAPVGGGMRLTTWPELLQAC